MALVDRDRLCRTLRLPRVNIEPSENPPKLEVFPFRVTNVFFSHYTAYWIAFGPHGPRAQPPKGEGWKILFKVGQLVLASVAVFYIIHFFAKPLPKTMSKEWQEASNEYAKVSSLPNAWSRGFAIAATASATVHISGTYKLYSYRLRRSTPSMASASQTTRARASSRVPPLRSNRWARYLELNRVQILAPGGAGIRLSHVHQRALMLSTWGMVLLTRALSARRMMGPRPAPI